MRLVRVVIIVSTHLVSSEHILDYSARLTAAHHAHGEDGVVGHLGVGVVGELAERVQDVQPGVGHGDEGQGEGHRSPQGGLPVTQLGDAEQTLRVTEDAMRVQMIQSQDDFRQKAFSIRAKGSFERCSGYSPISQQSVPPHHIIWDNFLISLYPCNRKMIHSHAHLKGDIIKTKKQREGERNNSRGLTRCPNVRSAISAPISSPMAMSAMPRTATPWEENTSVTERPNGGEACDPRQVRSRRRTWWEPMSAAVSFLSLSFLSFLSSFSSFSFSLAS